MATHIDLFPSLLHYVTHQSDFSSIIDGESIFSEKRRPYRMAVLQNGPDTPYEFTLQTQDKFIHARFLDPQNIYNQTQLEILSLQSSESLPEDSYENLIKNYFSGALFPLLKNPSEE